MLHVGLGERHKYEASVHEVTTGRNDSESLIAKPVLQYSFILPLERGAVRGKCLDQEHNRMSQSGLKPRPKYRVY